MRYKEKKRKEKKRKEKKRKEKKRIDDRICFDSSTGNRSAFASSSLVFDSCGTSGNGLDATSTRSKRLGIWRFSATVFGWCKIVSKRASVAK